MNIYIPTMGRIYNQITWDNMPKELKPITTLVCPSSEYEKHRALGRNVMVCDEHGIGNVRQFLCEQNQRYILMLDDDQMFFQWKSSEDYHLVKCTDEQFIQLYHDIHKLLMEGHPFVGIGSRQGNNNHFPQRIVENCRNCNSYGIDTEVLYDYDIKFNALPLMEDFHVQLSLLTNGFKTLCITDRVWNQYGSGAKGGCSTYRTKELQEQAAKGLKEAFSDFVKLVIKKNKTGWEGLENRTDVIVSWKKAYEYGRSQP